MNTPNRLVTVMTQYLISSASCNVVAILNWYSLRGFNTSSLLSSYFSTKTSMRCRAVSASSLECVDSDLAYNNRIRSFIFSILFSSCAMRFIVRVKYCFTCLHISDIIQFIFYHKINHFYWIF